MPDLTLCAPPPEQDCGWSELPDVIPDWVLEDGPLPEPLPCDCGCSTAHDVAGHEIAAHEIAAHEVAVEDASVWATPGVTGLAPTPVLPAVSDAVAAAQASVQRLASVDPSTLGSAQALADGEALLGLEQQLRVLNLRRVADVAARDLHELVGYRSTKAWLRTHRPDGDATDATLASQLRDFPQVREAVEAGRVPPAGCRWPGPARWCGRCARWRRTSTGVTGSSTASPASSCSRPWCVMS